jgi:chromosome segregation ATPase
MAATSGELQSRLAQRDEEVAQAWAIADENGQERDRLVAEAGKARADLVDAKGWVERLALTRTQMERRVAKLENALAKTSRDLERVQQRNRTLEERIGAPSSQAALPAPVLSSQQVAHEPTKSEQGARPANGLEQAHEAAMAELEWSRAHFKGVTEDLSETRSRLEECRGEIASLSDIVAEAQDRITDLQWQNEWLREAGAFLLEHGKWWWRFMPSGWQRRKRDARLLRLGMFDARAYSNRYPDVSSSGQDPFRHFIHHGIAENRRHD